MAKFETKIKANLDHLMEFIHNSLNPDYLPVALLETVVKEYDDVKIIFRKYAVDAGPTMVVYTIKTGEPYICVEILNAGMFGNKWVFEDGGDAYEKYLAAAFAAYDPAKTGDENRYVPPRENKPGFFDKLKEMFK